MLWLSIGKYVFNPILQMFFFKANKNYILSDWFIYRCNMCKEYIYKGKKFNSRKEDVMDEDYLGLKIFRFYIKCPRCVSEIAFKVSKQFVLQIPVLLLKTLLFS